MRVSEISKRYAKALYAVARQKDSQKQCQSDLESLRIAFKKDATIADYFLNPLISPDQKSQAVRAALGGNRVAEEVLGLLVVLAQNQRLSIFEEVVEYFIACNDLSEGVTRGVVRAAKPLAAEQQKDLEMKIAKALNKKIVLTYQEDAKLLGGVIAHVGGWTFDDSLETHLKRMNEDLNRSVN